MGRDDVAPLEDQLRLADFRPEMPCHMLSDHAVVRPRELSRGQELYATFLVLQDEEGILWPDRRRGLFGKVHELHAARRFPRSDRERSAIIS